MYVIKLFSVVEELTLWLERGKKYDSQIKASNLSNTSSNISFNILDLEGIDTAWITSPVTTYASAVTTCSLFFTSLRFPMINE